MSQIWLPFNRFARVWVDQFSVCCPWCAAAKARGVKLGINGARLAAANQAEAVAWAATVQEHMDAARVSGAKTLAAIAAYLNMHGVPSREGKRWHPSNVSRTIGRLRETSRI